MTSTTHQGDMFTRARSLRAPNWPRLRARVGLVPGLASLAAVGVLVLLANGHDISWLGGLVAGASVTAWLTSTRTARALPLRHDDGDAATREQLSLLEGAGWHAVHDLESRLGHYQHVAVGPGGVVLLASQHLEHVPSPQDPGGERELVLLRRRLLTAASELREEIHLATGQSGWVQPVVVIWSEFPAGCVQDGRCVFVSGPRLVDWLRRRPGQLTGARGDDVAAALHGLAVSSPASVVA